MRKFIFILLCVCTAQAAPQKTNRTNTKATPPLTVAERNKILKEFQDFLGKPVYYYPEINLFSYKLEEIIPPKEEIKSVEVPKKVVVPKNYELMILKSVGRSIKPDGSLAVNGQYVLCIQGSRVLKAGDILYAKYRDQVHSITLKSVTRKQFTLELNEKELTFQY